MGKLFRCVHRSMLAQAISNVRHCHKKNCVMGQFGVPSDSVQANACNLAFLCLPVSLLGPKNVARRGAQETLRGRQQKKTKVQGCKTAPASATFLVRKAMAAPPETTTPAQAGCRETIDWDAVLAQHQRWLRAVILARLQQPEAVDEVWQEVALAAVRQAAPLADPSKVAPWLYRLAVLQSLLYRRKSSRHRRLHQRYADQIQRRCSGEPADCDPLHWLLAREREHLLREALKRLAPKDAEILLLKYTQQWNYHQIAKHLGISHAAVETRLHRARVRLRHELAALDPAAEPTNSAGPVVPEVRIAGGEAIRAGSR